MYVIYVVEQNAKVSSSNVKHWLEFQIEPSILKTH